MADLDLLKHGRERILYGVPLVRNLRDYSLGIDAEPDYLLDLDMEDADTSVSRWWFERWCWPRAQQAQVVEAMRAQRTTRPIRHGARVPLPPDDDVAQLAFDDDSAAQG